MSNCEEGITQTTLRGRHQQNNAKRKVQYRPIEGRSPPLKWKERTTTLRVVERTTHSRWSGRGNPHRVDGENERMSEHRGAMTVEMVGAVRAVLMLSAGK